MINYTLSFNFPKSEFNISHSDNLLLIGSCFSDEISNKLKFNGFSILSNPFGTVFHPLLLSQFINESISNQVVESIIQKDEIFMSWDANSTIFETSEKELISLLFSKRAEFKAKIKTAKAIFITFGTAWGYRLISNNNLVANCHKMPSNLFNKELTQISDIINSWNSTIKLLKKINPSISIVFTVSPVRHHKDGLIENNQSKAILIEAIRQINSINSSKYFPSYEIMIDELRDYRFFKLDKVHPSEEAIEYIWTKFEETYFNLETRNLCIEVRGLKNQLAHRFIHPNSKESKLAIVKLQDKIEAFKLKNPSIILQ